MTWGLVHFGASSEARWRVRRDVRLSPLLARSPSYGLGGVSVSKSQRHARAINRHRPLGVRQPPTTITRGSPVDWRAHQL